MKPAKPTPAPRPPTTATTPPSRTARTASAPPCPRPARSSGRPATSWPNSATTRSPPPEPAPVTTHRGPLGPGGNAAIITRWGNHRGQLPTSRCQPLPACARAPTGRAGGLVRKWNLGWARGGSRRRSRRLWVVGGLAAGWLEFSGGGVDGLDGDLV